jgi:hypothetical protein
VDFAVSADAISNSGVLLIANYRVGGDGSSFAAIPSEVLMSLSALPVGGVRGTNRSDVPSAGDRLLAQSTEPQIRLMNLNQPSTRSEPDETTPAEQSPLSRPRTPSLADAASQFGSAVSILKSFTYNLEGVWTRALDNLFMNGRWQGPLSEWFERLPSSSPSAAGEEEIVPERPSDSPDDFDTALLNSFSGDARQTDAQPWAYAGLLLGMGAVLGADLKKRRTIVPAGSPWEPNQRMTNGE